MQCGLFYHLPCAPEQQAVTRHHEPLEQVVYADAEVRRRMEAITWEGGRGDHGAVRLPRTVCAETPGGARAVWDGSGDLLV